MGNSSLCLCPRRERGEVGGPEKLEVLCLERVSKRATRSPSLMEEDCTLNFTWNTMNAIQNNPRLFILKLAMKPFFFFAHRITKQFKCTQKKAGGSNWIIKKKFFLIEVALQYRVSFCCELSESAVCIHRSSLCHCRALSRTSCAIQ